LVDHIRRTLVYCFPQWRSVIQASCITYPSQLEEQLDAVYVLPVLKKLCPAAFCILTELHEVPGQRMADQWNVHYNRILSDVWAQRWRLNKLGNETEAERLRNDLNVWRQRRFCMLPLWGEVTKGQ
jgi:hypothetical protein